MHDLPAERAEQAAGEHPDRVRRRQLEQAAAGGQFEPRGLAELQVRRAPLEVAGPECGRRAVDVAELGHRLGHFFVEVPTAPAEEARGESDLAQPPSLLAYEGGGVAARRPRVI